MLKAALTEVRRSEKLRRLLKIILEAGNILNDGTERGESRGFSMQSLETLSKLKQVSGATLLDFLVETISRQSPDLLELGRDLSSLKDASKVELEEVQTEVKLFRTEVTKTTRWVTSSRSAGHFVAEPSGCAVLLGFLAEAQGHVELLEEKTKDIRVPTWR